MSLGEPQEGKAEDQISHGVTRPRSRPKHRPTLVALHSERAASVPVLSCTPPHRIQTLGRNHCILSQQITEDLPDVATQPCFVEKLLPRVEWQQTTQRNLRKDTVEGRFDVRKQDCRTFPFLAHLLDDKGEHDLWQRR